MSRRSSGSLWRGWYRGGRFERKFRPLFVAVLVSEPDATALAGGVPVGRGALLALSALRGGAVFWVSRDRLEISSIYNITVAAEMDMFPKYVPWVFVTPTILGAREDGKLCVDVDWHRDSTFADVIGALIAY